MTMNMQPGQPVIDPAFQKLADQAGQSLAGMYKMCHQVSPDSPLCEALVDMQKAVAEIESQYNSPQQAQPMDASAEAPLPEEAAMAEEVPGQEPAPTDPLGAEVPAEPSANPMFDAAAQLHGETQADAKKRKPAY